MSWIVGFWILAAIVTVGWLLYEARKPLNLTEHRVRQEERQANRQTHDSFIQVMAERAARRRQENEELRLLRLGMRQAAARKGWETRRRKQQEQELVDRRSWAYPYNGIYTVNVTTGQTPTVTEPKPEKAKRIYLEEDES